MANFNSGIFRHLFCKGMITSTTNRKGLKNWAQPTLRELKRRQDRLIKENKVPVIPRSALVNWNRGSELYAFGKRLNEEFHIEVLNQAFVQRSYIIKEEAKQAELAIEEPKVDLSDNRELSKIGFDLISKNVAKYISHCYPKFPKEGIKAIHDYLVSDDVLIEISKNLGTKDIILCGTYPPDNKSYVDTFTAIVGALFESQGEERVFLFVRDFVVTMLAGKDVNEFYSVEEPLKVLTDILKRDGKSDPEPRLIGQSAGDTVLASYQVGLYSDKILIGQSGGESIDIAIEMAARDALKRFFNTTENAQPIDYTINTINEEKVHLSLNEWSVAKVESMAKC